MFGFLGADGSSDHSRLNLKSKRKEASSGTNMFCSELTILKLIAEFDDNSASEVLYENPAPNSIFGICPLRYAYEKETIGNIC